MFSLSRHFNSSSRSSSVLAALLRLRNEFQRLGGNVSIVTKFSMSPRGGKDVCVNSRGVDFTLSQSIASRETAQIAENVFNTTRSSSFASSVSNTVDLQILLTDAMRLLTKGTRSDDPLSDLTVTSPQYHIEVGKLLMVASLFRASTVDARVAEALEWVKENLSQFQTTRQVISVCMPILNLRDGSSNGQKFIWNYLYDPLLLSLQKDNASDTLSRTTENTSCVLSSRGTSLSCAEASEEKQQLQNRAAVVSVFSLISKLLTTANDSLHVDSVLETMCVGSDEVPTQAKSTSSLAGVCSGGEVYKLLALIEAAVIYLKRSFFSVLSQQTKTEEETEGVEESLKGGGTSFSALKLSECTYYFHGSHAFRILLRTFDADLSETKSLFQRLDACDKLMRPIIQRSIAFAISNDTFAGTGARCLKPSDVINALKILPQLDSPYLYCRRHMQSLLTLLPRIVSISTIPELCALVQALNKVRAYDGANLVTTLLSPQVLHTFFESIRAKLFLLVGSQSTQMGSVECSQLLSGLSRLELSTSNNSQSTNEGSRVAAKKGWIASDVLNLLCVHFIADADHTELSQLLPFLQGLVRLKITRSNARGRRNVVKDDTDALLQHMPVLIVTLDKCAEVAIKLQKQAKVSALDGAHILLLLIQLRFAGCESFFLSIHNLFSSILDGALSEEEDANRRSIRFFVFHAVVQLITFLRESSGASKSEARTEHSDSSAIDYALRLQSRLYDSVLESVTHLQRPQEVIRFFRSLYSSTSTTVATSAEIDVQRGDSDTETSTTGRLADEDMPFLADGEADDVDEYMTEAFLHKSEESASDGVVSAHESFKTLEEIPHKYHVEQASLRMLAQRIEYVSMECNPYELAELSMAVAQLYRCHGLSEASAYSALDRLLHRASNVSLTVAQHKKVLDALRIAKRGDLVPLELVKDLSKALADATAWNLRDQGCFAEERVCLTPNAANSLLETLTLGQTILSSIKQQLSSMRLVEAKSSHSPNQNRNDRRLLHLEISISYTALCVMVINSFMPKTYPAHLRDSGKDLIALGYILAQLYRILHTDPTQWGELSYKPKIMGESMGADSPGYEDNDPELGDVTDKVTVADLNRVNRIDTGTDEAHFVTFQRHVFQYFNVLGDVLCLFLNQPQSQSTEESKTVESAFRTENPSNALTITVKNNAHTIEPKSYVMLIQSFGIVGVVHHNLLYTILPQIQGLAPSMDPLELSLLLNYLAQSGVCSRRVLDCLATEISKHVVNSDLRQCSAILRSIQRSGFMSRGAFVWPRRGLVLNLEQQIDTLATTRDARLKSSLDVLTKAVVERLDYLVRQEEQLDELICSHSLNELIGVIHAFFFFENPPQPTFDSYYILCTRKLVISATKFSQRSRAGYIVQDTDTNKAASRILDSALMLASCTHVLRRPDHQAISSRVIALSLRVLDRPSPISPFKPLPLKRRYKKGTVHSRFARTVFATSLAALSNEKLIDLLHASRVHWMLYDVKILPSDYFAFDTLLKRLAMEERGSEGTDGLLLCRVRSIYRIVQQLTWYNVAIPFQATSLRCAWRLGRFVRDHIMRPLHSCSMNVKEPYSTVNAIVTLCSVQNYLTCGSTRQIINSTSKSSHRSSKFPLPLLLLPGIQSLLLDNITFSLYGRGQEDQESRRPTGMLEVIGLNDTACLYLTHCFFFSCSDVLESEESRDLNVALNFFTSISSAVISRLELRSEKGSVRSCVDFILGSCLLLDASLCGKSTLFREMTTTDTQRVCSMVCQVLEKSSRDLSLKLHQSVHARNRCIWPEVYRLILGFERVLVRMTFKPWMFSTKQRTSSHTQPYSSVHSSQGYNHKGISDSAYATIDRSVNVQEVCENILYDVLMTIASSSRSPDGLLLCLGERSKRDIISTVREFLTPLTSKQVTLSSTELKGAQRINQVLQWITEVQALKRCLLDSVVMLPDSNSKEFDLLLNEVTKDFSGILPIPDHLANDMHTLVYNKTPLPSSEKCKTSPILICTRSSANCTCDDLTTHEPITEETLYDWSFRACATRVVGLQEWQTSISESLTRSEESRRVLQYLLDTINSMRDVTKLIQTQSDSLSHNASALFIGCAKLERVRAELEENLRHFSHIEQLSSEAKDTTLSVTSTRFLNLFQNLEDEAEFLYGHRSFKSAPVYTQKLMEARQRVLNALKVALENSFIRALQCALHSEAYKNLVRCISIPTQTSALLPEHFSSITAKALDKTILAERANVRPETRTVKSNDAGKASLSEHSLMFSFLDADASAILFAKLPISLQKILRAFESGLGTLNQLYVNNLSEHALLRRMIEIQKGFHCAADHALVDDRLQRVERSTQLQAILLAYQESRVGLINPLLQQCIKFCSCVDGMSTSCLPEKPEQGLFASQLDLKDLAFPFREIDQSTTQFNSTNVAEQDRLVQDASLYPLSRLVCYIWVLLQMVLSLERRVLDLLWMRDDFVTYLFPKIVRNITDGLYFQFRCRLLRVGSFEELCCTVEYIQSILSHLGIEDAHFRELSNFWVSMVQDIQERIVFQSSNYLRQEIALGLPDKQLVKRYALADDKKADNGSAMTTSFSDSLHKMGLYVPGILRALSFLRLLYATVEFPVFSIFAEETINMCLGLVRETGELVRDCCMRSAVNEGSLHIEDSAEVKALLCQLAHLLFVNQELVYIETKITVVNKSLSFSKLATARKLEITKSSKESKTELEVEIRNCVTHLSQSLHRVIARPLTGATRMLTSAREKALKNMNQATQECERLLHWFISQDLALCEKLLKSLRERASELEKEVAELPLSSPS